MKDNSEFPRVEAPSTSRRSVLAGLAALGVVYSMPGLFQVNEAMAEPARKPHGQGHPGKSRPSRKSRHSKPSRHSKAGKHHGRRSHPSKHRPGHRSHPSRPGPSRRSRASRVMRHPDPRRPI